MDLLVLNEHQVHRFKFYMDEEIHQGMRHGIELYGLIRTYEAAERLRAYELATQLVERNCRIVVTVSDQYNVWTRLNQYDYQIWRSYILHSKHSLNLAQPQPEPAGLLGFRLDHLPQFYSGLPALALG